MMQSSSSDTAPSLLREYAEFCKREELPHHSVEELLVLDTLTPKKREWLNCFLKRWSAISKKA